MKYTIPTIQIQGLRVYSIQYRLDQTGPFVNYSLKVEVQIIFEGNDIYYVLTKIVNFQRK